MVLDKCLGIDIYGILKYTELSIREIDRPILWCLGTQRSSGAEMAPPRSNSSLPPSSSAFPHPPPTLTSCSAGRW